MAADPPTAPLPPDLRGAPYAAPGSPRFVVAGRVSAFLCLGLVGCAGVLGLAGCADALVSDDAAPPTDMRVFDALRFDTGNPFEPRRDVGGGPDPRRDMAIGPRDAAVGPRDSGGPPIDARPPVDQAVDAAPPGENCDGLDDDRDGKIDEEGACGPYIATQCTAWLVWGDGLGRFAPWPDWGQCPAEDRDRDTPNARCTATRGDGNFARLNLPSALDAGSQLGVALRCADAENPSLAAYIQSHCAVYLGWDGADRVVDGAAQWGACPQSTSGSSGPARCVSSAYDPAGRFLAMQFDAPVALEHGLGLAWICRDDADAARATHLSESATLALGFAPNNQGPLDGSPTWGPCPGAPEGEANGQRCVVTRGDGAFRRMRLGGVPGPDTNFGLALRARRP